MAGQESQSEWQKTCPVANNAADECIKLAHGDGGRLMRQLIREQIVATLGSSLLQSSEDAAQLPAITGPLAVTTDSFVVSPLFFPGGDIGSLAVYGTVNDLAVSGARPMYLTLSLILEEGFPIALLNRVMRSVADAAANANVLIVAGDTKVVPRGAADGLFINTSGVGEMMNPMPLGPSSLRAGDDLIVTGPIGCHGTAVLCAREMLAIEPPPTSDLALLAQVAERLHNRLGSRLRAMRDATRGGIAAVLHEWAEASNQTLAITEKWLPVCPAVRGACELLGLDAVHLANEGTMVIAVESGAAQDAIQAIQSLPVAAEATQIGVVESRQLFPVTIRRTLGNEQPLDDPVGAPLPRIC